MIKKKYFLTLNFLLKKIFSFFFFKMNLVKFDQFKKTEHFIIDIHNETDTLSTELLPIANDLLNKIVYVNWPQMREAKVLAIRTATHNYCWSDINQTIIETAISDLSAEFKINSEYLQNQYVYC